MTIFLASNLIVISASLGIENWGHLQLVNNNQEIEVQSPFFLTVPFGGDWIYEPIQSHSGNTDYYGVFGKYRTVALNFGDRSSDNVWTVLSNIRSNFLENGIDYNFDQNSNSYINTLMYMVGVPLTAGILASVTPSLVTDGFPGVGTNVALNGEAFGFNLNLSEGKDLINTGVDKDLIAANDDFAIDSILTTIKMCA